MKKIVIIGAGGFGREVKMLIDQINYVKPTYELLGFYDDDTTLPDTINGFPNLGTIETLLESNDKISIALGIGIPAIKEKIIARLLKKEFEFPTLIHPNV